MVIQLIFHDEKFPEQKSDILVKSIYKRIKKSEGVTLNSLIRIQPLSLFHEIMRSL